MIEPELPPAHREAIANIGFGYLDKVIMAFEEPFWPKDTLRFKVVSKIRGQLPHFINLSGPKMSDPDQESHILACFISSRKYEPQMLAQQYKQLADETVDLLK